MGEFLDTVSNVAVLVFVVTCMAAAGLGLGVRDIVTPLRRGRLVQLAVLENFVVAPALAYGLTAALPLDRSYEIGLLLLDGAAGVPFLPKLAESACGDLALSIGLMLALMIGSVVFMPLLIPGLSADPWPLLQPLLVTILLPLAAGIAVKAGSDRWTARLRPAVGAVSNVSAILAVVLLIGLNWKSLFGTFGTGVVAVAVAVMFVVILLAVGYLLGGPGSRHPVGPWVGDRVVERCGGASHRDAELLDQPGVVVMHRVSTLAGLVVLLIAARQFASRLPPAGVAEDRRVPLGISTGEFDEQESRR